MKPIDVFALIFGMVWVSGMLILIMKNKSKTERWPHILGIGARANVFVLLMTGSSLSRPLSEFVEYAATNLCLSLPFGIIGYLTGRAYARRRDNKK